MHLKYVNSRYLAAYLMLCLYAILLSPDEYSHCIGAIHRGATFLCKTISGMLPQAKFNEPPRACATATCKSPPRIYCEPLRSNAATSARSTVRDSEALRTLYFVTRPRSLYIYCDQAPPITPEDVHASSVMHY